MYHFTSSFPKFKSNLLLRIFSSFFFFFFFFFFFNVSSDRSLKPWPSRPSSSNFPFPCCSLAVPCLQQFYATPPNSNPYCLLSAFEKLREATIIFVTYLRLSARNNPGPTARIFIKLKTCVFLENLSWRFEFNENLTRVMDTLREDSCKFGILSRWSFSEWNFSDKFAENIKTHILCSMPVFRKIVCFMR